MQYLGACRKSGVASYHRASEQVLPAGLSAALLLENSSMPLHINLRA